MLNALSGFAQVQSALGHDQLSTDLNARYLKAPVTSEYDAKIASGGQCGARVDLSWLTRDPAMADSGADCLDTAPGGGSAALARVAAQLLRHDWHAASSYSQPENPGMQPLERAATEALIRLFGQLDAGPTAALGQAHDVYRDAEAALLADPKLGPGYRLNNVTWSIPYEAQALAELGRTGDATALIAGTPLDCYLCLRTRGLIAEAQGNLPAAQRWFFQAAQQAPRLAPAFVDWGKLLAQARHYGSAEVKLSYAARLAPNWADPLKYWGDALAAEGKRREALAKYDAALKLAPKWTALHQARERAAR